MYIKGVTTKQVEEAKLLGITLKWSIHIGHGHIDKVIVKMGSGVPAKKYIFFMFDTKINFACCPVIWSRVAKKDSKLKTAQNRAACLALHCTYRPNISNINASLSWLRK